MVFKGSNFLYHRRAGSTQINSFFKIGKDPEGTEDWESNYYFFAASKSNNG